uniref:Uncharacterized protein n=1 Tax=Rhizophora mucronata TaxID=61149 RepID=A0A2P2QJE4_RHIMU
MQKREFNNHLTVGGEGR